MKKSLLSRVWATKITCPCFKCTWHTTALICFCLALSLAIICTMQIPSVHRSVYHDDPATDGGYTYICGVEAIKSMYQRTSIERLVVPPTQSLAKRYRYIDSTLHGFVPENPEMTVALSVVDTSGLVWFVWDQSRSLAFVCFFDGSCFTRSTVPSRIDTTSRDPLVLDSVYQDQLSIDRVRQQHAFKYFSSNYPLSSDPQVNRASMQRLIASYVRWTSSPDEDSLARNISLDTLQHRAIAGVDGWLDQHLRTLWKEPREAGSAAAGLLLLIVTAYMIVDNRSVWKNWVGSIFRAWWLRYSHKQEFKKRLPFGWRQFAGYLRNGKYHDFGLYYEYAVNPYLLQHQHERDREERSQTALEQYQLICEMNQRILIEKCGGIVPAHIQRTYDRQFDPKLGIFNRLDIARQLSAKLKEMRTSVQEGTASVASTVDEQILWERVVTIEQGELPPAIKQQFMECVRNAERHKKQSKRLYYLRKALALLTPNLQVGASFPKIVSDPFGESNGTATQVPRQMDDFPAILNIQELLPEKLNHQYAEWIVICLVRPGHSRPMVKEAYTPEEYIRQRVKGKIKGFEMSDYEAALNWLLKHGIIYHAKKCRHDRYYSLNPHPNQATELGRPIVQHVLDFIYYCHTGKAKVA